MSKYFVVVDGKALDFRFKKLQEHHSAFYIDDIYIGQIFKMMRSWSIVGKTPNRLYPIDGLKTRLDCCTLLLKLEGYCGEEKDKKEARLEQSQQSFKGYMRFIRSIRAAKEWKKGNKELALKEFG